MADLFFTPPPGWPKPPKGWSPPADWKPDPSWPAAPPDWNFWQPEVGAAPEESVATTSSDERSPLAKDSTRLSGEDRDERANTEIESLRARVMELEAQLVSGWARGQAASSEVVDLDDQRVMQEVGVYQYHHPLENSDEFRVQLQLLQERIKQAITAGDAIESSDMFTYNGSLAKGRRMTSDFSKLMLRAYNAEADNCVRALRAGALTTAVKRLESSASTIAKLGAMMEMRVSATYHSLRMKELEMTADYLMKVQEEREEAREQRERLREERKAEMELAAERERLAKERAHYANALAAMQAQGNVDAAADLATKLADIDEAIEFNDYRTANIRAGYVYVISNTGAFGPNMVKIGMTRRLEPLDRVRELGDASVPFPYDLHAIYFADDAVTLENELHKAFSDSKVNRVNERREFFFATPAEVRDVLADKVGNLLEFVEQPEAAEYFQSRGQWPDHVRAISTDT